MLNMLDEVSEEDFVINRTVCKFNRSYFFKNHIMQINLVDLLQEDNILLIFHILV